MLWAWFSESRVFCFGLTKYQQFWFFERFVSCIGRPFDHNSWALQNHRQIENVEITQGFLYFFDTRPNHIEWIVLTIKISWAIRNHRQIEKCWNYTRIFILFWTRIEWMLPTLENSWPRRNHRLIRKSLYFIRPMQKNDFLKSMQHVNFEPTCICQKVVPPELLLSLQSCACWSESVVGSPRSHKCLTGTATLVRYRTRIFQSPIFLFAPKWSGASQSVQPITVTDSPDDSRSPSLSDSQPITFTDSPDDPPLRQPALTGPVHAFSVHFSAPPNTFNIFILRQKCSRIALVRLRLERLQKLTFYNQTNEEN